MTWDRLRLHVIEALKYAHGTHTIEDVEQAIRAGEAQPWLGENAVMVTEVLDLPQAKVLHFWLCGGDLDELLAMQPEIEAWGRSVGCTKASTAGRPGWKKVLKDRGYGFGWEVCVKELA